MENVKNIGEKGGAGEIRTHDRRVSPILKCIQPETMADNSSFQCSNGSSTISPSRDLSRPVFHHQIIPLEPVALPGWATAPVLKRAERDLNPRPKG